MLAGKVLILRDLLNIRLLVTLAFLMGCWEVSADLGNPRTRGTDKQTTPATAFLDALLSKDERQLHAYTNEGVGFFESGHLQRDIAEFLYEDHGDWKSVSSIAGIGHLESVVIPQGENVAIVLYVPSIHKKHIADATFLKTQWMKKYFACQFNTSSQQWKLYGNFCFAETDGPFPEDIG
jgi:hypothetical protein